MEDTLGKTKKRALRILGKREFSEAEMTRRLISKGETREDAEQVAAWLKELGYINDEKYSLLIVQSYSSRGYGIARIKNEFYKREIPRELWDSALSMFDEKAYEAAVDFLSSKFRGSRDEDDIRKADYALRRRGFSYEEARMLIDKYLESL